MKPRFSLNLIPMGNAIEIPNVYSCRVRTAHQPLKASRAINYVDNEGDRDPLCYRKMSLFDPADAPR